MKLKMILLVLSMFLILSCQVLQNAREEAGRTGGFSVTTLTNTMPPIVTEIPIRTPINTGTPTLDPLTVTALSMEQSTQNAANAIATKQEKSSIATSTAAAKHAQATLNAINMIGTARVKSANSTATAIAKSVNSTATARAKPSYATEIAQYSKIDPNELVTNPNSHINESVVVSGRVFFVINDTDFLIWLDGVTYQAVYISMANAHGDIYENNYVTVYGIVAGEACGTDASGKETCRPKIVGIFYEKK